MRPRKQHPVALYRMYDADGRLLYIGQSGAPARRIEQHSAQNQWPMTVVNISVEWHPSRETAMLAEARAIAAELPIHNITHQPFVRRKWPPQTGGKVLSAWMELHGVSEEQLRQMTEISLPKLRRLIRGEVHATRSVPYQIEKATSGAVPFSAWARKSAQTAGADQ